MKELLVSLLKKDDAKVLKEKELDSFKETGKTHLETFEHEGNRYALEIRNLQHKQNPLNNKMCLTINMSNQGDKNKHPFAKHVNSTMAYNGIAHVLLPDSFMSVVRKSEILADMQKLSQDLEKVIKGDVIEFRPKNNHKEPEKKNEFEEEVEKLNGMNKFDRKVRLNELAYSPNIHHRMISALHPDTSVHDLAELMQDQHPEVVTLTIGHPHVKDALDKVQNKDTLNNLRERWSMVNGHHETKKLLKEKMFGENGVPISDYWKSKTSKYKV